MDPVTMGLVGGGAISALGSILGSNKQAKAAKQAAQMQMQMFERLLGQQQPFIQSGYGANSRLSELLGIAPPESRLLSYEDWLKKNPIDLGQKVGIAGMSRLPGDPNASEKARKAQYEQYVAGYKPYEESDDFGSLLRPFDADTFAQYKDPGYDFRLQQGTQGLMNSAAAGSGALSGAALKDLLAYNQDMAATEYGNAFNRYQTQQGNIFQRLAGIAGMGQGAAAGVGGQGTSLAGGAGQAIQNYGSAIGGGIVGASNAAGQGVTLSQLLPLLMKGG